MRDLKIFFSDNTQKYYLDIASIQGKIYTVIYSFGNYQKLFKRNPGTLELNLS